MEELFINGFGRLRSGWRFLVFAFFFFFFYSVFGVAAVFVLGAVGYGLDERSILFVIIEKTIGLVLATCLGWLCGKLFESVSFKALGWTLNLKAGWDFALGLLLGTAAILIACGIPAATGGINFQVNIDAGYTPIVLTCLVSFVIFFLAAAGEEALFRGYALQTFTRAKLAWLGILLTSLPFAIAHLGNPNATAFSSLNTFLAGIWLGTAYLKTRTLWFPFGLHLAWNWVQGAFLGIPVSGMTHLATAPLLRSSESGPQWLTGGSYGIEGGAACTVALVVCTAAAWLLPILKAESEMMAFTSQEIPVQKS